MNRNLLSACLVICGLVTGCSTVPVAETATEDSIVQTTSSFYIVLGKSLDEDRCCTFSQ